MQSPSNITVGGLEVRPLEHVVFAGGRDVCLTPREFEIVLMLAEHPGWVFSASQLAGDDGEAEFSPESVSVLVSRLRGKLAAAGVPAAVETVRGIGYRLHADAVEPSGESQASEADRRLRDATWQLQEALIEAEHSGTSEQQRAVADVLEKARRDVFSALAE